jgi:PAS domain S-box-containing protein
MMHSIDASGHIIDVSDYWLEVMGYARKEVIGRLSTEFLTEDSRRYAEDIALVEFYKTGMIRNVPYRFVKKNGEIIDTLLSAISEKDADGRMMRSLAVVVDITKQKQAEAELRKSVAALEQRCDIRTSALAKSRKQLMQEIEEHSRTERALQRSQQKYRQLFDGAPIAYLSLNITDGSVLKCNNAALRLLGYETGALTELKLTDLVADPQQAGSLQERLRAGQRIEDVETEIRGSAGNTVWVSITAEPLKDHKGHVVEGRFMLMDISERRRAERLLKTANDELEKKVADRTAELKTLKDRLQEENIFLREELQDLHVYGDIIGESPALLNVIRQIELVAPTDASVIILGESGTGKELVAREIHRHSERRHRPMIKVNCATIPRELYESEFFGHVKGAFTGASRDRAGRFEAADGGTLFLDEVAEIPLELQGKLLRVLQEGEYERIGEEKTRRVDVRIIAATNQHLKEKVDQKRFREDLYYRLNVFPIEVPPLRARKEDVRPLADYFLKQFAQQLNRSKPSMTRSNLSALQGYDWPGNVRELQNVIERAVILSKSGRLRFDLPAAAGKNAHEPSFAPGSDDEAPPPVLSEKQVRDLQRKNMLAALKRCDWKIYGQGGAAELLEIKPTTLIERMKRFDIVKPAER